MDIVTETLALPTEDGVRLHVCAWMPTGSARGVVCIVHGMGEHGGRYAHVASALVGAGLAVYAVDQRGHGLTPGRRGHAPSAERLALDAARFVGMPETALILKIYAIAGGVSALAGLVILARVNSANADYGGSYLLLVLLINILAGVSPFGGSGTVGGIVLAVITLQLISSGLNFLAFSAFARDLFFGGLLILVMAARVVLEGGGLARFRPRRTRTARP